MEANINKMIWNDETEKIPDLYGTNLVPGHGKVGTIMFVGEAPGEQEDKDGVPFCGKAGQLLNKYIKTILGKERAEVYVTNIVKQRPPKNRKPTMEELLKHRPWLIMEVEKVKPTVIMTLGTSALEGVLGMEIKALSPHVGGDQMRFYGVKIIPNYHPSALLRSGTYTEMFEKTFKILLDFS